jgi:purine-binding chemotaxis protein CheW
MNDMLLVIVLAGRRAVLPAVVVNSVIELAEVTPVPRSARHVTGLAALRSRPLTLIDCALSLDPTREPTDPGTCRAVVVEHEGHLYGLLVEAADDIVAARSEPGALGADPGLGWSRIATGRVETEAGALPFLDIAALIAGPDEALAA